MGLLLYFATTLPKKREENPLKVFSRDVVIILTGDVMLGRSVMTKSLDLKDPAYPFAKVGDILRSADIVFINLENLFVSDCPRSNSGFVFCADPKMIQGLVFAGVDIVNLANNHSKDYGEKGLKETTKLLKDRGIETTGLGNLAIKKVKGIKFGFLGFNFVSKAPKDSDIKLVLDSDKQVDVLIIGVHWGEEYRDKANDKQCLWAFKLVQSGADIVIGYHPHWVQNEERIDGKPVYYSLGNFVFDQMGSEKTRKGLILRATFRNGQLIKEEKLLTYMSDWGQPEFVQY